jgi:hypothetical protein
MPRKKVLIRSFLGSGSDLSCEIKNQSQKTTGETTATRNRMETKITAMENFN